MSRWLRRPYEKILGTAMKNKTVSVLVVVVLFAVSLGLFPFLGTSFIPEMQEGTLRPECRSRSQHFAG